ncbi:MAG TPA: histidinol-phosphate transaminase, partial [Gaiellaceae bacterium]
MRALASDFRPYAWAPPTDEVARLAGIDPSQVLRFDQNTPLLPISSTRPGTIAGALARVSGYPAGGYRTLRRAIADYAGVEPENVVLGAGADDLILLCARAYAGPGDTIAIPAGPTYPLYRIAAQLAGAEIGDDEPALTFACRPNNPTGELGPLPAARPLVVDEAYFEYCGETALDLIDEGVVVLRTFSKLFGLAGARVGYALAARETADELNARQAPAPVSTVSAALAIAALAERPDPAPAIEERDRLAAALRALGLAPLESFTNFLYVPVEDGLALGDALLRQGIVVRAYANAIRASVLDAPDDDLLVEALARVVDRPSPVAAA